MSALHERAYLIGDAVKGIADALQLNTDEKYGCRLGATLEVVADVLAKLAEDIEMAGRSRAKVSK